MQKYFLYIFAKFILYYAVWLNLCARQKREWGGGVSRVGWRENQDLAMKRMPLHSLGLTFIKIRHA